MYIDSSLTTAIPAITTAAAGVTSYNAPTVFDLDVARNITDGTTIKIVFNLKTPFATANAADILNSVIRVLMQTDDNPSFTSPSFVAEVGEIGGAGLGLGPVTLVWAFPAPLGGPYADGWPGSRLERYIRFRFDASNSGSVAFSVAATGSVSIVLDSQTMGTYYADAISTLPNPV